METILLTGGTGTIGKYLTTHLLKKGYRVIILTRQFPAGKSINTGVSYASWNINENTIDTDALQKADHIIHLAGAGVVDRRWSSKYKKEIQESRTKSTALLVDAMKKNSNKIKTLVSASAVGWYGADNAQSLQNGFTEDTLPNSDFLGETCRLWEQSVDAAASLGKRIVKLRTGIVLSEHGGALEEFKKPIKFGIASILGNGKQVVSWIHVDDLCRMYIEAIQNPLLSGSYNAVAPNPVSNKTLTLQLAKTMRKNAFIPIHVPAFVLKILLGESSIEVLKSCTVNCKKIKEAGFTFLYPSIEFALNDLCKK